MTSVLNRCNLCTRTAQGRVTKHHTAGAALCAARGPGSKRIQTLLLERRSSNGGRFARPSPWSSSRRLQLPPVNCNSPGGSNSSQDPDPSDPFDRILELLVDYATAGCLAVVIGFIAGVPALGNFHLNASDIAIGALLMVPIYALDAAMMLPDFQANAKLRSRAELADELGVSLDSANLTGDLTKKMVVFDSWAAYYKWLLDGNQVDCIVNDPTINIPTAPRLFLILSSALAEEMLFRAVLVTLLGKGLAAGIIAGGLEDVAPWGATGTGAVAASFVFAAMIALVPLSKVQKASSDSPEVEVLIRNSDSSARIPAPSNSSMSSPSTSGVRSDGSRITVMEEPTASAQSTQSSRAAAAAPPDAPNTSANSGTAVDELASSPSRGGGRIPSARESSNGVATYHTAAVSTTATTTVATRTDVEPAAAADTSTSSNSGPGAPSSESHQVPSAGGCTNPGWPYVSQRINPIAVYKSVQGARNVVEVLVLNLVFVGTGNLAASFVSNALMQVVFTGYQIMGEQRIKNSSQ